MGNLYNTIVICTLIVAAVVAGIFKQDHLSGCLVGIAGGMVVPGAISANGASALGGATKVAPAVGAIVGYAGAHLLMGVIS